MTDAKTAIARFGRLAIGAAFLVSGFAKAVAPAQEFALTIETYQILPVGMTLPMARIFPWIELFLGAFVLLGWHRRYAAAGAGASLGLFIWALGTAQLRGIDLGSCGCFGSLGPQLAPWQATLLDFTLLALAYAVWRQREDAWTLDAWIGDLGPTAAPARKSRAERRRK